MDKNHSGQNLPDKRPSDKSPGQKPRQQLRENLYRGLLSGFFVLGLLKKSGGPRCVTYFWGVPGCVTKCDRGEGSKLAKNSVTYFMDGPLGKDIIFPKRIQMRIFENIEITSETKTEAVYGGNRLKTLIDTLGSLSGAARGAEGASAPGAKFGGRQNE